MSTKVQLVVRLVAIDNGDGGETVIAESDDANLWLSVLGSVCGAQEAAAGSGCPYCESPKRDGYYTCGMTGCVSAWRERRDKLRKSEEP